MRSLRRNRHSRSIQDTPPPKFIPEMSESDQPREPQSPVSLSPCRKYRWTIFLLLLHLRQGCMLTQRTQFRYSTRPRLGLPSRQDLRSEHLIPFPSPYLQIPIHKRRQPSTILSENSTVSEEFVKIDMEMDPKLWEARNERRYRMSLTHRYHHSRVCSLLMAVLTMFTGLYQCP